MTAPWTAAEVQALANELRERPQERWLAAANMLDAFAARLAQDAGTAHEVCICAAWKTSTGYIVRGHRHNDCAKTAWGCQPRLDLLRGNDAQGFMTTANRFVTRDEGLRLQLAAGIASARPSGYQQELYSEDLY
jgi:hypothetical protein